MLADQLDVVKQRASDLYKEALEHDIDPSDLDADFALVELDLAEYTGTLSPMGVPAVEYLDPDGSCSCCEDDDDED